jgi:phosphate transport system substrate-binding protein
LEERKMRKKILATMLMLVTAVATLTGCGANAATNDIYVVSREDGSGTRGAFVELMGIEQKDDNGEKVDMTIDTAEVTSSTSVMITTVQGNEAGIGYISLGSYDPEKVKAITVDGVEATVENVKNGSYKVSRPFNIATKEDVSEAAKDFIANGVVVREKGEWRQHTNASVECPVCEGVSAMRSDFCPNCGADMRKKN